MSSSGKRVTGESRIIGENLRFLRRERGLTMQDIAEGLNITHQQVQKYESGINRLPLQSVPVLCDLLGVPAEAFLRGIGAHDGGESELIRVDLSRIADQGMRLKIIHAIDVLTA